MNTKPTTTMINPKELTNEELLKHRANAYTTHCLAGGHTKAEVNKAFVAEYDKELKARGITPPPDTDGEFNGPGSF